jgi:alanyl-tRNA synthetase
MTVSKLRQTYLAFFESKGHVRIPSASLVPENDPSVLFTTAGMHPLVPYLMGESHPSGNRLTNVQKCIRTGDIDEVGDNTHLTFFEMLGNWSLQDYFKEDAIKWSHEFLTNTLCIPVEKLAVSVFAGDEDAPRDEESAKIWLELGIPQSRIAYLGKEDNWWGPAGHTGPCGPDTEMFYWTGESDAPASFQETSQDSNWVEIWNDVFIQYNKQSDGSFVKLDKPSVDTGMGLERTAAVLQGKSSVYDTEIFDSIINSIEGVAGSKFQDNERLMRIIADHVRTSVMMIADGVAPSNKDQGYILRRLIRRAIREMAKLNEKMPSLKPVAKAAIESLVGAYHELENENEILILIETEEVKFTKTLSKGIREFEKLYSSGSHVSGEDAFKLFSTYGFPLELTQELVREKGANVDSGVFEAEFKKHQDLSRAGSEQKFAGGLADHSEESKQLHTATHLLHKALRLVLGDHVVQRGSNITPERLRFDFSHETKMTDEEKRKVEDIVNEQISKNLSMSYEMMTVEEAKLKGAIGLFEDKYAQIGEKIKVYTAGEGDDLFSSEICGGPHVDNIGILRAFAIKKEEASSAGIRRIKAVVGEKANDIINNR